MILESTRIVIATDTGAEVVEGWTIVNSPLAIHQDGAEWILTLRENGYAVLRGMAEIQARYALRLLSPYLWAEPYHNERLIVARLKTSFADERARGPVSANKVVAHFVRRLVADPKLLAICGPCTEMWELIVAARAQAHGICHAEEEDQLRAMLPPAAK